MSMRCMSSVARSRLQRTALIGNRPCSSVARVNTPEPRRAWSTPSCSAVHDRSRSLTRLEDLGIQRISRSCVRVPSPASPVQLVVRRALCSRGHDRKQYGEGSAESLADVHVTHVEAADNSSSEATEDSSARQPRMMPEEDRVPIGAGSAKADGEPTTVRFLDVPGSEQTREEKMTAVFTCTICETRTAKTFAKLSYEKGVVIARCPGCHNLHLIADRLGWFEEAGDAEGGWDIEKITNRIGESECHVVNEDNVMELNLVDIVGRGEPNGGGSGGGSATS